MRRLLFTLAVLGLGPLASAEIALLSSGQTLKLEGHRVEDAMVVLLLLRMWLCNAQLMTVNTHSRHDA